MSNLARVLSAIEVCRMTTIKRSSIYNWVRGGHFPKPLKLGPKKRGWLAADIEKWLESKREKAAA